MFTCANTDQSSNHRERFTEVWPSSFPNNFNLYLFTKAEKFDSSFSSCSFRLAPFRLLFTKLPAPFAKRDELPPVSGTFLLRRFSEHSNFLLLDVGLASALCVHMSDFLALNETRDTCFLSC